MTKIPAAYGQKLMKYLDLARCMTKYVKQHAGVLPEEAVNLNHVRYITIYVKDDVATLPARVVSMEDVKFMTTEPMPNVAALPANAITFPVDYVYIAYPRMRVKAPNLNAKCVGDLHNIEGGIVRRLKSKVQHHPVEKAEARSKYEYRVIYNLCKDSNISKIIKGAKSVVNRSVKIAQKKIIN